VCAYSKEAAGGTGHWATKAVGHRQCVKLKDLSGIKVILIYVVCVFVCVCVCARARLSACLRDTRDTHTHTQVPCARLAGLLRSDKDDSGAFVGETSCPLAIGLRVQVCVRVCACVCVCVMQSLGNDNASACIYVCNTYIRSQEKSLLHCAPPGAGAGAGAK